MGNGVERVPRERRNRLTVGSRDDDFERSDVHGTGEDIRIAPDRREIRVRCSGRISSDALRDAKDQIVFRLRLQQQRFSDLKKSRGGVVSRYIH